MNASRYFYSLLVCLMIDIQTHGQSMNPTLADILEYHNLAGMAVGVACGDETIETYFGGLSQTNTGQQITENTYFRIASISKSFTAVALLKLLDSGPEHLDTDVSDILGYTIGNPAYPDLPITSRMLLSHTSSLQDGDGYSEFLSATYTEIPIPNISEVILPGGAFFTTNMWRTESPGAHFAYANINYGLIGTLIEALSGVRFDVYMREEVLLPLGISGSFNIDDIDDIENVATLYRDAIPQADNFGGAAPPVFDGTGYLPGTNGARFAPQGGLRCALNDLLTFGKMLLNDGLHMETEILDSTFVAQMLSPQWTYDGNNGDNYFGLFRSWGLGIHRALGSSEGDAVFPDITMLGHPGEAYGLLSDLYVHPETGFVFAFITNGYLSGGGYEFGQNSTFYRVEEEVFEAIYDTWWAHCSNSLSVQGPKEATEPCMQAYVDRETKTLYINEGVIPVDVSVYDMMGRNHLQAKFDAKADLGMLPAGMYFAVMENQGKGCVLKFALSAQ